MKMVPFYLLFLFCLVDVSSSASTSSNTFRETKPENALQKLREGLAPLEPMVIEKLDLEKRSHLHQVYENMKIFGLTTSKFLDANIETTGENCRWRFKYTTPFVRMESDYTMKGHLFILPVKGHGKCTIYFYDVHGTVEAECQRHIENDNTYIRITDFKFDIKPKSVVFDYENLVDGNEDLSRGVNLTLNVNSEILLEPLRSGLREVVGTTWRNTFDQVFARMSEDQLFMP